MAGLPQLFEEDVQTIEAALDELLHKSEASAALAIDMGGPLVTQRGDASSFDAITTAALAAGSFCAIQAMANRVGEPAFNNIYQQGEQNSVLVSSIDEILLLVLIFKAELSVGVMKFYSTPAIAKIASQIKKAQQRASGNTLDLVSLNVLDASAMFGRKTA